MIMANVPLESQQNDTLSASSLASYNLGSTSGNTMRSNKPYTAAVRPVQTAKKEASSFDGYPASSGFRAPRTLQPPPGTFYKPPSINREKQAADLVPKTYAAATSNSETGQGDTVKNPNDCDATSSVSSAQLPSPNSSPEDLSQSDVRPVYQRLRPRRLQELENREAHFV